MAPLARGTTDMLREKTGREAGLTITYFKLGDPTRHKDLLAIPKVIHRMKMKVTYVKRFP